MFKVVTLAAALSLAASAAFAHSSFEQTEIQIDKASKFTLRIPHGCGEKATKVVKVEIPAGVINVKPMPKADWALATVTAPYAKEYDTGHAKLTEGVSEISWTGELPAEWYDEFSFRAQVSTDYAAGDTLYVKVTQLCDGAEEAWVEVPAEGQSAADLKKPAPSVTLSAAPHHMH